MSSFMTSRSSLAMFAPMPRPAPVKSQTFLSVSGIALLLVLLSAGRARGLPKPDLRLSETPNDLYGSGSIFPVRRGPL
jgi:hypothetical protein